jgi:hypothetical protein
MIGSASSGDMCPKCSRKPRIQKNAAVLAIVPVSQPYRNARLGVVEPSRRREEHQHRGQRRQRQPAGAATVDLEPPHAGQDYSRSPGAGS